MDLQALVRPNIWALEPYRCARDDYETGILLDANENSFGTVLKVEKETELLDELERYPDPHQMELKKLVAKFRGVQPENIFVGVGSDEAIDILLRIFCHPGKDSILICPPTYGMYKVSAAVNDVRIVTVPMTPEFQPIPEQIRATVLKENCKIIFLCSPGNPTGNDIELDLILRIVRENNDRIVVIDEAYIDFSQQISFTSKLKELPNIIVLQTCSKSFGMAGVRLGMAFSQPAIISFMNKVKAPYNVSKMASKLGIQAFSEESLSGMRRKVDLILKERERLVGMLKEIPQVQTIYPSSSNFLLVRVPNALRIYKEMAENGVVVRYRGNEIHCNECLRISIGTPEEDDKLIELLRAEVAKSS